MSDKVEAAEEDIEDIEEFNDVEELNDFCIDDTGDNEQPTQTPDFSQEISTLVSAIGSIDQTDHTQFIRGEYCARAIARLEYLLRNEYIKNRRTKDFDDDTDNNEIFNKCGEFMVVSKKLVPCFKQCMSDCIKYGLNSAKSKPLLNIVQQLMKMFTRFTFPLTSNIDNTIDNYVNHTKYYRFLEYQQTFKKCLIDNTVLYHIIVLMGECHIEDDPDERSEMDIDLLELYLCLLRNILSIPDRTDNNDFLQDRAILALREESVMDVLIELSTNIYEESDKIRVLLMDIFYQYFRMESADSMTRISHKSKDNKNGTDLLSAYKQEKLQRISQRKRRRHKNFGGLSRVRMMNGQTRIQSLGIDAMSTDNMFDRRRAKRFRPVCEEKKRIYLSENVSQALRYVSDRLLLRAFTPLMNTMHMCITKRMEHELNESTDCKKWMKLMSLFLKYHRLDTRKKCQEKAKRESIDFNTLEWYSSSMIACVLKESVCDFIIGRAQTLFESRKSKHFRLEFHFHRLQATLSCYKEIIRCIYSMLKYGNEVNKSNALKLFTHVFEGGTGPALIRDMINEYKVHQSTKLCLAYCIEAVYYTIAILEMMQSTGTDISVKTKRKQKRKKRKRKPKPKPRAQRDGNGMDIESEEKVEVAGMEIDMNDFEDSEESDENEEMFYRKDFEMDAFMGDYASNKVVTQYMYILEDYASNSAKLNSYIIAMFNRLAFKMKYAPLLYSLSHFVVFDRILNDQCIAKDKNYNIVRKFCTNILRTFFRKAHTNKVLFSELLFHKTPHALSDINEPGTVYKQIQSRREKESRMRGRVVIEGLDNDLDMSDDFGDEEEYKELQINMTEWVESEDKLLREYYPTYATQANAVTILQNFLETELEKTRSEAQIDHRLRQLGLRKGKRKRGNTANDSRKRVKPRVLGLAEQKSIVYCIIHKALHSSEDTSEASVNTNVFRWFAQTLDHLCDLIGEVLSAERSQLIDDIAIVPTEFEEFGYFENLYLMDLVTKLGFLKPSQYLGTLWWRIPREFKLSDIQSIVGLIGEALELPREANLSEMCAEMREESTEIALLNENNGNGSEGNAFESERAVSNDKKEQSESEDEYQICDINEMKQNSNTNETNEVSNEESAEERKKRKKEKKRRKKEKKKRKKERKKRKKERENGGEESEKSEKKKKKKRKSKKRKRDKITKEEMSEMSESKTENNHRKRRRLNVSESNDKNEENSFFDDSGSDMSEDNTNETDIVMNTPQIKKFAKLALNENSQTLNVIKERESSESEKEEIIVKKRKVTRRAFLCDSESD